MDDALEVEEGEAVKTPLDGWELSEQQRRFIESLIDEGDLWDNDIKSTVNNHSKYIDMFDDI
ncbi:hypothetical protein ACIP6T_08855 [Pantoea sp. NPDC088449]|uniref:hypothetical protein n=1 Tax=Pantoea sp. NPDC088449 TaxID=3364392 RepID=UPI0038087E57